MPSDASAPACATWAGSRWLVRGIDWLTKHEKCVLSFGAVFQVVFLVVMMIRPVMTLATGDTILLRVVPVDPRDLFRGDYVILSYEITRPAANPNNPRRSSWERLRQREGQTIYVLLEPEPDGKHWQSGSYEFEQPSEGKFIRGTVGANGLIQFGIEQYFVQEGQGHDYEKAVRDKKLSAEIALDKDGAAQLKRLVIE